MKGAIRSYLAKGFDNLFTSYRPKWLDLAAELSEPARDLIRSDVGVKYPQFAAADDPDTALAQILDTDATVAGTMLYRLSHALFRTEPKHAALAYLSQFMRVRTGMEIYYSAEIGPRLRVMHGVGLVLGPRHRIGSDLTIYQGVTLGQRRNHCPDEFLTIGDRCTFFAGSAALGLLKVGDDVKLAANAVLLGDAAPNSTYAGAPAVKVK